MKFSFHAWYFQLGLLLLTLIFYLFTAGVIKTIFGVLIFLEILVMVIIEVRDGVSKYGAKHELLDTLIALVVALVIWYGSSFLLNTSAPISAVASCSMLPNLERGDFVIVQGAGLKAHEISMKESDIELFKVDSIVNYSGNTFPVGGSIYSYCAFVRDEVCNAFFSNPNAFTERKGPLTFHYSSCEIKTSNCSKTTPCIYSVEYDGKTYKQSLDNDVLVYSPDKQELHARSGDIVHRAFFKINSDSGNTYYLTLGDNNPIFDVQMYDYRDGVTNYPIAANKVKGKVILRVPYLGFFKLLITPAVDQNGKLTLLGLVDYDQCKTQLKHG